MAKVNLESQMYKLNELQTELIRGKEQYEKAIPQYDALLDIIAKSGREAELPENFVETTTEDKGNIQKGLNNINKRLGYIEMLFDKHPFRRRYINNYIKSRSMTLLKISGSAGTRVRLLTVFLYNFIVRFFNTIVSRG